MNYTTIDTAEIRDGKAEVLAYPGLGGFTDARAAERLFFLRQAGVVPKTVRITLHQGKARLEPGALYQMQGNLEFSASTNGGIGRALFRKVMSGETFFVNEVKGTGEILLEPSWGHFVLLELDGDDDLIVEKGMFYAGIGNLEVSAVVLKNLPAGVLGGEGFFQTRIKGSGIAVLLSPVPWAEIVEHDLTKGKLSVDGPFALMRTGSVEFRVEKSSKSWIATSVSGEGLLQTFSGKGRVWVAPTLAIYQGLATQVNQDLGPVRADRTG